MTMTLTASLHCVCHQEHFLIFLEAVLLFFFASCDGSGETCQSILTLQLNTNLNSCSLN